MTKRMIVQGSDEEDEDGEVMIVDSSAAVDRVNEDYIGLVASNAPLAPILTVSTAASKCETHMTCNLQSSMSDSSPILINVSHLQGTAMQDSSTGSGYTVPNVTGITPASK